MLLTILVPAAILGVIVIAAVLFFQRGTAGLDASPRNLLRIYLYLGSLASILVLVFGLTQTLTGALGLVAPDFTYGAPPSLEIAVPQPPAPPIPPRPTPRDQHDRQTRESLLQGVTSAAVGGLFWLVHWYGRRQVESAADRANLLRRAYFMVGVAIFGVASIALLPAAAYNTLRWLLLPVGPGEFRQGAGESLAAAVVVVPVWLLYLRVVLADYRATRAETDRMPS